MPLLVVVYAGVLSKGDAWSAVCWWHWGWGLDSCFVSVHQEKEAVAAMLKELAGLTSAEELTAAAWTKGQGVVKSARSALSSKP